MYEIFTILSIQRAKKVVSDSLRVGDFAISLVDSVLNLPMGVSMRLYANE